MQIDFLGMHAFLSVVEQGGFVQAATHLNLSHRPFPASATRCGVGCATIEYLDNPPHNLNLVMVITAATRRNGESPRHQKRENERHVESAGLSG
jgi:hypothetical protein